MKKNLFITTLLILLGFLFGKIIFNNPTAITSHLKTKETYYFLQEGVYSKKENININRRFPKVIEENNHKYYAYIGITKNKKVAEKLRRIYENMGYQILIKEKNKTSEEFDNNIVQYDLLINATNDKDEILTIEEVVLANYEETKKNSSKN